MSDEEYENCYLDLFNKLEYRDIPSEKLTGEKWHAINFYQSNKEKI